MPWFRFDSSALNDEKLLLLHKKHGHAGIGLYLRLICLCYEADGELPAYKLPLIFEAYEEPQGEAMFSTMVNVRLFSLKKDKDGEEVYTSKRVTKELDKEKEWRKLQSERGKAGGQASAEKRRLAKKASGGQRPSSDPQPPLNDFKPPTDRTVPTIPNQARAEKNDETTTNERQQNMLERKQLSDDETLEQFYPLMVEFHDEAYADKTVHQFGLLRGDRRTEVLRKMRVMINSAKHPATTPFAKKVSHEIAGCINDFGEMERKLTSKEVAKRREFAKEEMGTADAVEEVGDIGSVPDWQ